MPKIDPVFRFDVPIASRQAYRESDNLFGLQYREKETDSEYIIKHIIKHKLFRYACPAKSLPPSRLTGLDTRREIGAEFR